MDKIIQGLRSYWNLLFQLAVWGYDIVTKFIAPPPSTALACPPNVSDCLSSIENLAKYGLTFLIGLSLIATRSLGKRRHLPLWIILTVMALVGAYGSYAYYDRLQSKWICEVDPQRPLILRIKGEQLTEEAQKLSSDPACMGEPKCKALLSCFENDPKQVWQSDEIDRRRVYLTATYFSVMPLFVLGIICITQAIYCAMQEDSAKQFVGRWKSSEAGESTRGIELVVIIANKKINGRLLNELDPPDIADAEIKGDTLTFVHGRNRTEYEMNLVNENEASLVQKNNDKSRTLFKN